jgi:integrase
MDREMNQLAVIQPIAIGNLLLMDPLQAIKSAGIAESTRAKYTRSLERYLEIGILTDSDAVIKYADNLTNSGKKIFKAALRIWQKTTLDMLNGQVTPDTVKDVEAIERRFDAMQAGIHTTTTNGTKAHTWLSKEQVLDLLGKPDTTTTKGMRDKVVLGLAVGCGLRRAELAGLKWSDIVYNPSGMWFNVQGKGNKSRELPIPSWLKPILTQWQAHTGKAGHIARAIGKHGDIRNSLTGISVFRIVVVYGESIGIPELAAHDLRRTGAQNLYKNCNDITIVQRWLGHSSIETTRKYLNVGVGDMVQAVEWL